MRLVFAGTPVFAQRALAALAAAGHEVALVLTRPDKPAHRGQQLVASPVKQWALEHGLEVWQPPTLRDPQTWPRLRALEADAMIVAAYGLILPAEVLAIPRHGCLNIHASLLPRWRGAAPIQRAIEAGDTVTGVTIMQMDEGLDTGAMRLVREWPIGPQDTGATVHDALAGLGAQAIVDALAALEGGTLPSVPQPADGVTYANKLAKADASIEWSAAARVIVDRVRAFDPVPGCTTPVERVPGAALKVWKAHAVPRPAGAGGAEPGAVLAADAAGVVVACGDGAVALVELQRPGGRRLPAREFLAGFPLRAGDRLRASAP
ncbi:MAG: hypothetical protein RJA99_4216 [Pseudomonadota bacterium]|jgi:methionyl-tRNA formyltransferase